MRRPIALLALALVAVASLLGPGPTSAQKGPIKVGFLVTQTGPLAANGKDMLNGLELFLQETGAKLAGREVKLIVEDDESKPATGLVKIRSLVRARASRCWWGRSTRRSATRSRPTSR